MDLSMNRAYNVANFVFQKCSNKKYGNELTHTVRVEGVSSAKPIIINGIEDKNKSRRVELRLLLKNPPGDALTNLTKHGGEYEDVR